jgi:hypothetical protein
MLFTSCAKTIMFILMTLHNMHLIVTNTALIMNIKLVGNKGGELLGSSKGCSWYQLRAKDGVCTAGGASGLRRDTL